MNVNIENLKINNYFQLVIPNLYLRGGKYGIRILLSEIDTSEKNFVDVVDHAAYLNILPGDIWKTGKINRQGYSCIIPARIEF